MVSSQLAITLRFADSPELSVAFASLLKILSSIFTLNLQYFNAIAKLTKIVLL